MAQDVHEERESNPVSSATGSRAATGAPVEAPDRISLAASHTRTRLPAIARALELPAALICIAAVMAVIQFSGRAILDNDGPYHIRWATLLRQSFPQLPEFNALPLTTLDREHYVDHHYLYHVLLFPFTFGDLRIGAKLAAVVFSALGIGSVFALLSFYKVRYRWLWLAPLIASSEPFLYRMSMTRAPAMSLMLLGIGSWLIFNRKFFLLALMAFAFVWSYSLFPLIFVFGVVYSVTLYLSERRIDLWAPLATGVGIIAGLIINPYFPKNLRLFGEHLMMKVTGEYPIGVGVEWYTYESWYMLTSSAIAFAVFFFGLIAFEYRDRVRDWRPLFFLIVSVVLLLMSIKSRRFMEYFPPFAVAFGAFTISPKLARPGNAWVRTIRDRLIAAMTASAATVVTATILGMMVLQARAELKEENFPYAYEGASKYITEHTAPGAMVFNTNWDTFPSLFYYNPDRCFVAGLDPSYSYDRDHDLWKLYESITNGDQENAGKLIREQFGAEYVVTGNGTSDFLTSADDSGEFERVYEDNDAIVLRVRDPGEVQPSKESEQ